MPVFDLRNMITMDPVLSIPIQTWNGLVDLGFYRAFDKNEGVLAWIDDTDVIKSPKCIQAWGRVAILSGGIKSRVVAFNTDFVYSNSYYADGGDITKVIYPAEYTDLHYLATLCSQNQLAVTPPGKLASASPPALTLDRDGSLAVYIGRAGCGAGPDKDILLFRPTSTREEDAADVAIITQLLEPILTERTADGTIVFESYGHLHRKTVAPDEIIMFCVDSSSSMGSRCDFADVQINEDNDALFDRNTSTSVTRTEIVSGENQAYHLPDTDELKGNICHS